MAAIQNARDVLLQAALSRTQELAAVTRFKLIEQPEGVKQFFWTVESPSVDIFSFEVRYSLGGVIRPWDELITLFSKNREARQHEVMEPRNNGVYTFAIRCVDTSGVASAPLYITETLVGAPSGVVLKIVLPHEEYWPGTKTECIVEGSALTDAGTFTWDALDVAWDASDESWVNMPTSPIAYEHNAIDLGSSLAVTVRANSLCAGVATIQMRTSLDNTTFSAWASIPNAAVTARYFKFRWSVTGISPVLYRAQITFYT